jgi:hypothetical protein
MKISWKAEVFDRAEGNYLSDSPASISRPVKKGAGARTNNNPMTGTIYLRVEILIIVIPQKYRTINQMLIVICFVMPPCFQVTRLLQSTTMR